MFPGGSPAGRSAIKVKQCVFHGKSMRRQSNSGLRVIRPE
jgi:hypothetical protein